MQSPKSFNYELGIEFTHKNRNELILKVPVLLFTWILINFLDAKCHQIWKDYGVTQNLVSGQVLPILFFKVFNNFLLKFGSGHPNFGEAFSTGVICHTFRLISLSLLLFEKGIEIPHIDTFQIWHKRSGKIVLILLFNPDTLIVESAHPFYTCQKNEQFVLALGSG